MTTLLDRVIIVTVADALKWGERFLSPSFGAGAAGESLAILSGLLQEPPTRVLLKNKESLQPVLVKRFQSLVIRRSRFEPVAYLLGQKNFMGRDFIVDERVLVPRPETEIMVEMVCAFLDEKKRKAPRILDMGTGSGCIGVSLALLSPEASVVMVDVSRPAVRLAQMNARRLGARNTQFFVSYLYSQLPDAYRHDFDIIVSNPPYIRLDEETALPKDLSYEPRPALFAGADGLQVIRPLIVQAPMYLRENGSLFVEIGHAQGRVVEKLMQESGFAGVRTGKDFQNDDRFVIGEKIGPI